MKKSRIAITVILSALALIGVLLMLFSLVGFIRPINREMPRLGDRVEINPELGIPVYTRKNPITGSKEYFYAVFSRGDNPKGCLVRADKEFGELFEADSKRANTLIFRRGTVKKFTVPQEMKSIEREIGGFENSFGDFDLEYDTYIDLTANERYLLRLIIGAACAAAGVIPMSILKIRRILYEKE